MVKVGDFVEAIPIHIPRPKPPLHNVSRALSSQGFAAQVERGLACPSIPLTSVIGQINPDPSNSSMPLFYQPISGSITKRFFSWGSVLFFIALGPNGTRTSKSLRDLSKTGSGLEFWGLTDTRPMVPKRGGLD